jgi:hypothetical protein
MQPPQPPQGQDPSPPESPLQEPYDPPASDPVPPPPPRSDPALIPVLLFAVAAVLIVALAFIPLGAWPSSLPWSSPATVTITDYWFEWSSPPSSLCDGWTSNAPRIPFTVALGAHFNLSWQFACWNGTGSYTIDSIYSLTGGFTLVSSNLPVRIISTDISFFNVTLAAPTSTFYGGVSFSISAHSN